MLAALILAATLTVTDYATMPQVSSPRWSPDGKRIAYVVTEADLETSTYDSDVWIIGADGTGGRRLTYASGTDNHPRWSPDGKRIAFLSDRDGRTTIHIMPVDGGEATRLFESPTALRDFEWSPDGSAIAFTRPDAQSEEWLARVKARDDARVVGSGAQHVHLHLADVASGMTRQLTSGDYSVFGFDWAPDGARIVIDRAPEGGLDGLYQTDLHVVRVGNGGSAPLVALPGLDRRARWSPDGTWIAFTSVGGTAHWIVEHDIYVVPAAGGTPRRLGGDAISRTPEDLQWSDDSSAVIAEVPFGLATRLVRLGLDGSVTMLTGERAVHTDADFHGERSASIVQSLTTPPELHVEGRRITDHNSAYRARELGETRVIHWKNPKDGREIDGLLTLPTGYRAGSRVPLLTFVHGGPASRFDFGYLGYLGVLYAPHALAAEGFAVLRPNPRGTGGYGIDFRAANRSDWAGMDWLDVEAGIDKVIADGIADPERLGLMGWSYGGYLASWALGHSDRFRAISIGAPVVDLLSFHGTTDIRGFIPSYFPAMPLDLLRARSPLWHLRKTDTKVLIQHGESDDRVPLSQGSMLYRVLDDLGVDVTMVIYPRTPHVPREPKLRIDVARRNLEFFREHVK